MLRKSPSCQEPRAVTGLVGVTIYCPFLNRNNSPPPHQFLRDEILLKIKLGREMLIEQIIEYELRVPEPPGPVCTPTTGNFHDKAKISKATLCVDYYLLLKYFRGKFTLLSSTWAKSLTKFNPKMQDFKRVLDLKCK